MSTAKISSARVNKQNDALDRQKKEIMAESSVVLSKDILVQKIDDHTVFLNLATEQYCGIDEIGSRMWQLLTSKPSIGAAHEELVSEFDADSDRIGKDLLAFVEKLRENGIIDVENGTISTD